jgi:peptidyl-tRNA hydrolase
MKKPVMYILANRGLGMTSGKLSAQVAHAACEAMILSPAKDIDEWRSGGHYTKIILSVDDEQQMANVQQYIETRGFQVAPIIDEGRTEIKPFSRTAIGVAIVDKDEDHVKDTFGSFKLYKEFDPPKKKRFG